MSSSLQSIMNMGSESLQNSRQGLDVTGHNIANAQTPGYSKQVINLQTKIPTLRGGHCFGNGARVNDIARSHDRFLETQILKESHHLGYTEAQGKGLVDLEDLFNPELTSTVRDRMVAFENSLRDLSNFPEETSVRLNVVECAQTLIQSLQANDNSLNNMSRDINAELDSHCSTLNKKFSSLAQVNQSIKELKSNGSSPGDLEDQRDGLIRDISHFIDIKVYEDERTGYIIRGPGDVLLMEGQTHSLFSVDPSQGTVEQPAFTCSDITGTGSHVLKPKEGRLGGLLNIRDSYIPKLRENLNTMAYSYARKFNETHEEGFGVGDYSETSGRKFFEGLDDPRNVLKNLKVTALIQEDPRALATAITGHSPGDNVIANRYLKLLHDPLIDRKSTLEFYDTIVGNLGTHSLRSQNDLKASKIVVAQLDGRKESISGVSLDEEATELIKYQHLFAASSKIITTMDELFQVILQLKR
jgi:flagellar hook-associated protein 1 FlgK